MKTIFNKIVSNSDIKPELAHVLVSEDKLVATNSYSLIEVAQSSLGEEDRMKLEIIKGRKEGNVMLKPEELDMKKEILETMPFESAEHYPAYQQVMPTENNLSAHYSMVEVSPKILSDILISISKTFKSKQYQAVYLYVPKRNYDGTVNVAHNKVFVKRADNSVTGVVMPLNRHEN